MKKDLLKRNNKAKRGLLMLLVLFLMVSSCQDRLDKMNQNPNALTEIPADFLFTNAVRGTFRASLGRMHQDFGAQLSHLAVSESWDRTTDQYDNGHLRGDVTQSVFSDIYRSSIRYCNDILALTGPGGTQENEIQYALTDIIAVVNFARLTDLFGDVPYFQGGMGKDGIFMPEYDAQEDIYADMVERLNKCVDVLKGADFDNAFPGADPIYNNDKDKWLRFANSFRLRLAMRARFADAGKYNPVIDECLKNPLIEENTQNATLEHWDSDVGDLYNPWYNLYRNRNESKIYEFNVSEKYVDWLRVTSDPRLEKLVTKATMSDAYVAWLKSNNDPRYEFVKDPENAYFGMRNGLLVDYREGNTQFQYEGKTITLQLWPRKDMSFLTLAVLAKDQPLYLMCASEIWLLRAEAALYDLGPGDANAHYQEGVKMAMEQWGIDPQDYLANSSEKELSGSTEQKFERICNQMWISFVPNYVEAWMNIRRTGYPKIAQRNAQELSKGATDGYLPKRLRFPQTTERNINGVNMQKAIDRMGGDNIDTPVWWDVKD